LISELIVYHKDGKTVLDRITNPELLLAFEQYVSSSHSVTTHMEKDKKRIKKSKKKFTKRKKK